MLKKIKLYYDKECPFCNQYSKYVELKKIFNIEVINARENPKTLKKFNDLGYDINKGMLIEYEEMVYQGSDAIQMIDKHLSKNTIQDKFLSMIVNLPGFKSIFYPIAKIFRRVILKVLGKNTKIEF